MLEVERNQIIESRLKRIADYLVINSSFLPSPGLLNGSMGSVIFLFVYSRRCGQDMYADYACELIEKIQKRLHLDTEFSYANGLAGIGVGLDFLIRNSYIEADSDEFLEDFDKRLLDVVGYGLPRGLSLERGVLGLCRYFLCRYCENSVKFSATIEQLALHVRRILETCETDLASYLNAISILLDYLAVGVLQEEVSHCIGLCKNRLASFAIDKGVLSTESLYLLRWQLKECYTRWGFLEGVSDNAKLPVIVDPHAFPFTDISFTPSFHGASSGSAYLMRQAHRLFLLTGDNFYRQESGRFLDITLQEESDGCCGFAFCSEKSTPFLDLREGLPGVGLSLMGLDSHESVLDSLLPFPLF